MTYIKDWTQRTDIKPNYPSMTDAPDYCPECHEVELEDDDYMCERCMKERDGEL